MSYILSLSVSLLAVNSCEKKKDVDQAKNKEAQQSQKPISVPYAELNLRASEGRFYHNNVLFSGEAVKTHPSGAKAASIHFFEGRYHGKYTLFFPHGQKSFESEYDEGNQDGITKSWWATGILRSQNTYKKGVPHGEQLQWYRSGAKFKKISLINGQEVGLQQAWRENGKLYNNYEARNGRIFGLKRASMCFKLNDEEIQISTIKSK